MIYVVLIKEGFFSTKERVMVNEEEANRIFDLSSCLDYVGYYFNRIKQKST